MVSLDSDNLGQKESLGHQILQTGSKLKRVSLGFDIHNSITKFLQFVTIQNKSLPVKATETLSSKALRPEGSLSRGVRSPENFL